MPAEDQGKHADDDTGQAPGLGHHRAVATGRGRAAPGRYCGWTGSRTPAGEPLSIPCLGPLGTDPEVVIRQLTLETDVSARRALILCLGEFSSERLSGPQASLGGPPGALVSGRSRCRDSSACDWLLRNKLQRQPESERLPRQPALDVPGEDRAGWYLDRHGHTMAVFHPVEFWMGSPTHERDRYPPKARHRVRIPRSFAIAIRETTQQQFVDF